MTHLHPMHHIPQTEGYKLTAKVKATESRLFDEVPDIRLIVCKDHLLRWVLRTKDVEIAVNPTWFDGWSRGWREV